MQFDGPCSNLLCVFVGGLGLSWWCRLRIHNRLWGRGRRHELVRPYCLILCCGASVLCLLCGLNILSIGGIDMLPPFVLYFPLGFGLLFVSSVLDSCYPQCTPAGLLHLCSCWLEVSPALFQYSPPIYRSTINKMVATNLLNNMAVATLKL